MKKYAFGDRFLVTLLIKKSLNWRKILISRMRTIYPEPEIIYSVKDNISIHETKIKQSWLKERKDKIRIDWSALCSNLNII